MGIKTNQQKPKSNNKKLTCFVISITLFVLLIFAFIFFRFQLFTGLALAIGFCNIDRTCGALVGVNCHAEIDGDYYFISNRGELISTCGGACMGRECKNCPPAEWTCGFNNN